VPEPAPPVDTSLECGQPFLLDVRMVAKLTSLSERSVWRAADSGRMPRPLQVGGRRLWRRSDLEDWITAGCPRIVR